MSARPTFWGIPMADTSDDSILSRLVRPTLALLVVIDIVLGGVAVFFPHVYMSIIHPYAPPDTPVYLLQRAGVVWLGYLVMQALAFFGYTEMPEWVLVVGILRLIEVPADTLYVIVGTGFGWFGHFGLIAAPTFNLIAGSMLVRWYFRTGRKLV
jgi:hypothetical protein